MKSKLFKNKQTSRLKGRVNTSRFILVIFSIRSGEDSGRLTVISSIQKANCLLLHVFEFNWWFGDFGRNSPIVLLFVIEYHMLIRQLRFALNNWIFFGGV